MIEIPLLNSDRVSIIDDCDSALSQRSWKELDRNGITYVSDLSGTKLLHRVIMCAQPGVYVDHKDLDGLNNRRSNLRYCTHSQNQANRRGWGKSGFKGVARKGSRDGRRWEASIKKDGVTHYLGHYLTKEEAALAYNEAAKILHGEFARLNVL